MGVLGPGQFERERDSLGLRPRDEGRHRALHLGVDGGLLRHLQHGQQQRGLGEGRKIARDFGGLEVLPRRGTLVATDDGTEWRTSYDDCVMVMPSMTHLKPGTTMVRLGRFSV